MKKRVLEIALCTAAMLIFTLVFGYMTGVLGLTGVASAKKDMNISEVRASEIGIDFSVESNDDRDLTDDERSAVSIAENFIEKSMEDSGLSCNMSADYENKCLVCRVKSEGAAQAAVKRNDENWNKVVELGLACSETWMNGIRARELDDWHFSVVVLNDLNSGKAILICTDGELIYNCGDDIDKQAA